MNKFYHFTLVGSGKISKVKMRKHRGNLPKENGFSSHHSSFSSTDDLTKDEDHPPEFPVNILLFFGHCLEEVWMLFFYMYNICFCLKYNGS